MKGIQPPDPEVTETLRQLTTREDLENARTLNFAGAGVALAIILLLAQVGVQKTSQVVSLAAASVALPFWLCLALRDHFWMWMKITSPEAMQLRPVRLAHNVAHALAQPGLLVSLIALVYGLSPLCAWLLGGTMLIAFATLMVSFLGTAPLAAKSMRALVRRRIPPAGEKRRA
jgi:hypothetical protein